MNMSTCGFVLVYAQAHVCLFVSVLCSVCAPFQCVVHQEAASRCFVPLCLTLACTEPLSGQNLCLEQATPVFPLLLLLLHILPTTSLQETLLLLPSFLPLSLLPPVTAVWAFIAPLPPSSFYLSTRMKDSVKEYV